MAVNRTAPLIFLVDDDPDFVDIHQRILETNGYRVHSFSSPLEALAELEREVPDLILTDLMMQELDSGFSFTKRLKANQRWRAIPVILVTAISSERGMSFNPHSEEELHALGADAYFEKPLSSSTLLATIVELLQRSAGRKGT
jgi:CheY-like chemotaxis protein